jgi:hypothetical protein
VLGEICDGSDGLCFEGCHSSSDCPVGESCSLGSCFVDDTTTDTAASTTAPGTCAADADCALGEICDPDFSVCVDGCHTDVDCPGAQVCDSTGQCSDSLGI